MARPDEIKLADELRRLANLIDPPQLCVLPETREAAAEVMRAAADAMQYGNCNYWCPACYADVSDPKHRAGVPPVSQASDERVPCSRCTSEIYCEMNGCREARNG